MTAAKRRKPNTFQFVCAGIMLFCFSVYGIYSIVLNELSPWKTGCCVVGILYAVTVLLIYNSRDDGF